MNFDDVGGGIGGTADYNTFHLCQREQRRHRQPDQGVGQARDQRRLRIHEALPNVGQPPAPSGDYAFDISATDQTTADSPAEAATSPPS